MAKLEYEYPIKTVRGKLKDTFGASKRKQANNKGEQEPFSVIYGKRTTDVGTDEAANRTLFGTLSAMVQARRKNQTQRLTDQTAFKAQSTYKTMTAYLWHVCKVAYEAQQEGND